ncbi:hypothetical protein KFK09_005764 [Dendrobium nobile]|uniref:Thioredoxin domain-containing protein n=1 Tax=Dendrobium nobile TaxID=94219 RepID=A0A8T3C1Z8_DENNO|nr:hypothetical protein KFK09_005764 [Dendrobium nobile]
MSVSRWPLSFFVPLACLFSVQHCGSSASLPFCPSLDLGGIADSLRLQCPLRIERSLLKEVNSDNLDKELVRVEDGRFNSVLFCASWSPFSQNIRPIFEALSSMFPKNKAFNIKFFSCSPLFSCSAFSRYGIHSFPSIFLANRTAIIRYHGSKDLDSLVQFYRETTGQDPVIYFSEGQANEKRKVVLPWSVPTREFINNEPYRAFSILFVILRSLVYFFFKIISQLKTLWMLYAPHQMKLRCFSELSDPLGRVLHVINMKKAWNKLRLSNKKINFDEGAKSARVCASSFASVSLGDSSSSSRSGYLDS